MLQKFRCTWFWLRWFCGCTARTNFRVRSLRENYAISYLFYLHLMLYACVERFDVMGGRENILGWKGKWTRPQEDADGLLPEYMRRMQIATVYGSALLAKILVVNALMVDFWIMIFRVSCRGRPGRCMRIPTPSPPTVWPDSDVTGVMVYSSYICGTLHKYFSSYFTIIHEDIYHLVRN
jgi:hypothetical protein